MRWNYIIQGGASNEQDEKETKKVNDKKKHIYTLVSLPQLQDNKSKTCQTYTSWDRNTEERRSTKKNIKLDNSYTTENENEIEIKMTKGSYMRICVARFSIYSRMPLCCCGVNRLIQGI